MEWRSLIYLVLVSLLWPVLACGAEPVTVSPEALKAMAAGIRQLVEDDEAVGAEVLVLHKRKVVLHEAFGWSDLDRRTPFTRNTIVCVRSMTKPLVGTAIQMLIDEGKLSLTDRASKYLKSFDNDKSRAVTIEQLLTHTAGFPLTLVNKQLSSYSGQRAIVDEAGKIGPSSPPGSFKYSDTDSETLAAIVAEVSGQPDRLLHSPANPRATGNERYLLCTGEGCTPAVAGQLQPRRVAGTVAQVLGSRSEAVLSLFPGCRRSLLDHDRLRALPHALARSRPGRRAPLALRGGRACVRCGPRNQCSRRAPMLLFRQV